MYIQEQWPVNAKENISFFTACPVLLYEKLDKEYIKRKFETVK